MLIPSLFGEPLFSSLFFASCFTKTITNLLSLYISGFHFSSVKSADFQDQEDFQTVCGGQGSQVKVNNDAIVSAGILPSAAISPLPALRGIASILTGLPSFFQPLVGKGHSLFSTDPTLHGGAAER